MGPIKVDKEYFDMLNKAIMMEIQAVIQYMTQHSKTELLKMRKKTEPLQIILGKNKNDVLGGLLKDTAIAEMKHVEKIAERIFLLGGEATAKAFPPKIGDSFEEFLQNDLAAEAEAMEFYRTIIKEANERGDITTKEMIEEIYMQEEDHYWAFDEFVK
ncbi:MAG TPA: ferritin-like domain-containing protein [Candidatus Deferrimicrobium sp.]|nr:ferritin-like domain-containing protein [Candidatus Deferrimicrobium sp.]